MDRQGHIRSSSSSSLSSFDSCSDLLGSLEFPTKSSMLHAAVPESLQPHSSNESLLMGYNAHSNSEDREKAEALLGGMTLEEHAQFIKTSEKSLNVSHSQGLIAVGIKDNILRLQDLAGNSIVEKSSSTTTDKCEVNKFDNLAIYDLAERPSSPTKDKSGVKSLSVISPQRNSLKQSSSYSELSCRLEVEESGSHKTPIPEIRRYSLDMEMVFVEAADGFTEESSCKRTGLSTNNCTDSDSKAQDLDSWHIERFLKSEEEEIDMKQRVNLGKLSADHFNTLGPVASDLDHTRGQKHSTISGEKALMVSDIDFDIQELEYSIKYFDVQKSSSPAEQSLSTGSAGPKPSLKESMGKSTAYDSLGRLTEIQPKHKSEKKLLDTDISKDMPKLLSEKLATTLPDKKWKVIGLQEDARKSVCWVEEDLGPDEIFRYLEALDVKETYLDTIDDACLHEATGGKGKSGKSISSSVILGDRIPFKLDWVEVVGASQRKGGASIGERMVGVKDHTVYCVKVCSGKKSWEVLRRYRDFIDLNCQLRRLFNSQTGRFLPSPWEELEADSRKVFGNTSPKTIEARSWRMEKCLQSLLQAGPPFNTASPLFWFLRPKGTISGLPFDNNSEVGHSFSQGLKVQLGALDLPGFQSTQSWLNGQRDKESSLSCEGKIMNVILKIHPTKPFEQILDAQQHSCAGCYKHLGIENGLVRNVAQTIRRQTPRLCEYSGQLFCTSCHLKETAVLPAHVLQHWDFTPRKVSQLAKAYLDSIYDQPMLCASAVHSYLYARVPTLAHVKEIRRRLSKLLSCVRCPLHGRIQLTMGSRRYLLENNDYFSLRDLEDLSRGVFAVLPGILKAVSEDLKVHITKRCSLCQDTGEWCGAGVLCEEPFSAIFPFQEENITDCQVCHAIFHRKCFGKCKSCPSCPDRWSNKILHHKQEEVYQ